MRLRATDTAGAFADDVFSINILTPNNPAAGLPIILGSAEEDQMLSVDLSQITDADGFDPDTISVQWFHGSESSPVGFGATYTLGQADVGAEIIAKAAFRDGD